MYLDAFVVVNVNAASQPEDGRATVTFPIYVNQAMFAGCIPPECVETLYTYQEITLLQNILNVDRFHISLHPHGDRKNTPFGCSSPGDDIFADSVPKDL